MKQSKSTKANIWKWNVIMKWREEISMKHMKYRKQYEEKWKYIMLWRNERNKINRKNENESVMKENEINERKESIIISNVGENQ